MVASQISYANLNMKKIIWQGSFILIFALSIWTLFRMVNWMEILPIRENADRTEAKLGKLIWEIYKKSDKEIKDPFITKSVDSIVSRITKANNIPKENIKLHLLKKDEVNAFALPDNHLIIYSGLIKQTESPEALAGVIGHEIAHMELNHVMKKLIKEFSLAILTSAAGSSGGDVIREAAKFLSSAAFDRRQEKEADIASADFLIQASIDPEPFAAFLYQFSEQEKIHSYLSWLSTHPHSTERAKYLLTYIQNKEKTTKPILHEETWRELQVMLEKMDDED